MIKKMIQINKKVVLKEKNCKKMFKYDFILLTQLFLNLKIKIKLKRKGKNLEIKKKM